MTKLTYAEIGVRLERLFPLIEQYETKNKRRFFYTYSDGPRKDRTVARYTYADIARYTYADMQEYSLAPYEHDIDKVMMLANDMWKWFHHKYKH